MALKGRPLLLVGFTLFSMFFGAGNLIFPPYLGALAGSDTWIAMVGFALTAIGFPILGVIAVARAGGLKQLSGRVHPWFAAVFIFLIYLSIGPGLAIPRTAGTSFEMLTPFWGDSLMLRTIYSGVFFSIAAVIALQPEQLTKRLGKILCPLLLLLIAVMFFACLLHPVSGSYGEVQEPYTSLPFIRGFLDGYQTMDAIAALNFGAIITLNIKAFGVTDEKAVVKSTVRAGFIAGIVFLIIYSMLAHIGGLAGGAFPVGATGADVLTSMAQALFGPAGGILLAEIFFIACLNTCTGLLSCCSEYFTTIFPRISYRVWVIFFALISMLIANVGLSEILRFSVPVLNAIYPPAIVLILLSFLGNNFSKRFPLVYPVTIALVCIESILSALLQLHLPIPFFGELVKQLPLHSLSLGWVVPACAGILSGLLLSSLLPEKS